MYLSSHARLHSYIFQLDLASTKGEPHFRYIVIMSINKLFVSWAKSKYRVHKGSQNGG